MLIFFFHRQTDQEGNNLQDRDDEGLKDQPQSDQYWQQQHRRESSGYSEYGYQLSKGMQRMELVGLGFHVFQG